MKLKLEIKEEADEEIIDAYLYYETQQNGLGERFLMQLGKFFDEICENPKHFATKKKNFREAYIRKFPYIIIYEIENEKIVVFSVFNTSQNPKKKPFFL
jgi:plasmid stabilization system protein ParE